jgi:prepilin-type N-terminal cleavage/methylation domain-containing protein
MRRRGFTLLEVMVAVGVLAGALTGIVLALQRAMRVENTAKLMTTAVFLARGKMSEFEDELYEKGFSEFADKKDCEFEKEWKRFTCKIYIDKVELPSSEQVQTMMTKANELRGALAGGGSAEKSASSSSSPTGAPGQSPLTAGAGAFGSQFGLIKDVLEQGIRRVTVIVGWREGKRERDLRVVAYYTDPRKVDQAINLSIPGNLAGGAGGPGGAPPASGTGQPGTGTIK